MKPHLRLLCFTLLVLIPVVRAQQDSPPRKPVTNFKNLRDGDLVFIKSSTSRAEPIEKLTGSSLTHCGIIFLDKEGKQVVYEGAGRNAAHYLTIKDWQRDESTEKTRPGQPPNSPDSPLHSVYARRLKTPLSKDEIADLKKNAAELHATQYDFAFQLGNKEPGSNKQYVYCSELIYEAFRKIHREVGEPRPFSYYYTRPGLTEEQAKHLMEPVLNREDIQKLRTPKGKYRPDELVISPEDVYISKALQDITDETSN
jgi:hypothetical protein